MTDKPQRRPRQTASVSAIDAHVGERMRERRLILGMSQEKLGEALGISFQQIQKYERGTNRIGAGRLFTIGQVLGVAVSYFFDGLDAGVPPERLVTQSRRAAEAARLIDIASDDVAGSVLKLLRVSTGAIAEE